MIGWKKNLEKQLTLNQRIQLLKEQKSINEGGCNPEQLPKIPIIQLAELLKVNRTSTYYTKKPPSAFEVMVKHRIDELHTDHPSWGQRQLSNQLKFEGFNVGRLKVRKYMIEMGIKTIYPKPRLSDPNKNHKVYPYLLRNYTATRPNEVWSIDITYIRLKHGFVYLTAIIDWYSRAIVGWELDDTLETPMVIRAVQKAFKIATPKIMNSDQGSQFTSNDYIQFIKNHWDIKISMDGVGRWADNIFIERWFRTLKYDEVYLNDYENMKEARLKIASFIKVYNTLRTHSAIGNVPPAHVYFPIQLQ